MHDDEPGIVARDDARERLVRKSAAIVDHMRARVERGFGNRRAKRIDREYGSDSIAHERAHDGYHPIALFLRRDLRIPMGVRLAADIDDVGAERDHLRGPFPRAVDAAITAAIVKRIRRDVNDTHHLGTRCEVQRRPPCAQPRRARAIRVERAREFVGDRARRLAERRARSFQCGSRAGKDDPAVGGAREGPGRAERRAG